jgi:arylsulfatase A-like enzyme
MTAPARPRLRDFLALGLVLGLASGLAGFGALQLRRVLVEPLVFVGRHAWWTAPAANAVLFLVLAAGAWAAARLLPRLPAWQAAVFGCGLLGTFGALYAFPQIHRVAALVLSAGVATVLARRLAPAPGTLARVRRWAAVLGVAWLVAAGGAVARDALRERRALAALPPARAGAPNVLLIVLDTVRAMSLSLYGYSRPTTPELERWAARGVTFTRAYSTAPWTLPSHASMLTGRWMHELSADWMVPLDGTFPTLAEVLRAAGYRTAGFVANTDYASAEVGLARGFIRFEDYTLTPGQVGWSSLLWRAIARVAPLRAAIGYRDNLGRKKAPAISAAFLRWAGRGDAPFFALLNYYDAHRPYLPPPPWDTRFVTPGVAPHPRIRHEHGSDPEPPPERIQGAIDAYDNSIAWLDSEIGRLLDALARRGLLDSTIVIITSDHGEEFLEHGAWDHGNTLYHAGVHVPLVLLGPGLAAGARVDGPVSVRDIPATVLDLAGLAAGSPFPGRSLAVRPGGPPPAPDTVYTGVRLVPRQPFWYPVSRGDLVSATAGPLRFIRNLGDGTEELFDVVADPMERRDLAADSAGQATLPTFRRLTDTLFRRGP